jgi:hypothetical protein
MTDRIRDAFMRGKSVAAEIEESSLAAGREDRRNLELLWQELQKYASLASQAGYVILPIQHWWIPIRQDKYVRGREAHITWERGVCRASAIESPDRPQQYVFEFGTSVPEAVEKLMYHIGCGTLMASDWD